jgi:hypothetical protein
VDDNERRIAEAIALTRVVRPPKQHLATFGVTNVHYYLVTEPSYRELSPQGDEGVIREGRVISERPAIVTPTYMLNLEGFSADARRYMEWVAQHHGPHSPGLLYRYRNEPGGLDIVSGALPAIAQRIGEDLDKRGEHTAAVILGVDAMWDVSLLKFIHDYTAASLSSNVMEMQAMGLLEQDSAAQVPRGVIQRIEALFQQVERGLDPSVLKKELDRWGLFERYQDRFLALFRRR